MTNIKKTAPKTFLALSASMIVPAHAADVTFLPDIPASQIAQDTVRSYDSRTGVSVITAPTFDPFEQDNTLAGTANLRTGPSETTIDGTRVIGGAYLDLKMIYTSQSDDPYDLRGFEQSYYVSGEPVARIRQDVKTLDCASNTTEVVYQDDYYNSYDNYGYLAGLYLLLPRYRGHRGYWSSSSRHRPSHGWGDWRRRGGYGAYDDSYGSGYFSGPGRRGYGSRGRHGRGIGTSQRDNRRADRDERRDADREDRRDNEANTGSQTRRAERHNGRRAIIGGSRANRSYTRRRGVVTGEPLNNDRTENRRQREGSSRVPSERRASERADRRAERRAERNTRNTNRAQVRTSNSNARTHTRQNRPAISNTISNRRVNPAGSAPRPIARSAPPASVRPAPAPRPRTNANPKAERKARSNSTVKTRANRKLSREVDRSFKRSKRDVRGKTLQFFPVMLGGYSRASSTVTTNYRCVREETLTLHIPQERLDAARFDGMTLVVVDNADRDVPVYLPPNYIEGFRQATGRTTASYGSGQNYQTPSPGTSTTIVTPQREYRAPVQGRYPQN